MNVTSPIDMSALYADILSSFSVKQRLDVIAFLTDSLRMQKKQNKNAKNIDEIFARMSEDWGGDATPEEIASEIRANAGNGRNVDVW